jgi:hypothetical protein
MAVLGGAAWGFTVNTVTCRAGFSSANEIVEIAGWLVSF